VKLNKLGKYFSWLGPYPYNPGLIFIFFASWYFSRFLPGVNQQPEGGPRWLAGLIIISIACIPSGMFALLAMLVQRYRFWPSNLLTYVMEVGVGQACLVLFSPVISSILRSQLGLEYSATFTLTPSLYLATLLLVLGIFAIMHRAERSIRNRLDAAGKLVSKLELDREGLVRADIELREQTSRFLHDRVQSDLMVAAMKLKSIAGKSSDEVNGVIELVRARLEQTRMTDLRDLVQVLAPHFEASGFLEAIKTLAEPYGASMEIDIFVDESTEALNHDVLLGAFRIIEQSLLNALVHGPAKHVKISMTTDSKGQSQLEISDDGPGSSTESTKSGVGTAVIDAWLSILKGTKSIETVPGHGYRLTVVFPTDLK
jgi:signal transduction histidine kinase